MTDVLLEVVRQAVRAELAAALDARLTPVLAALRAATPPARGLSVEEYARQRGVSACTVRRQIATGSLPHTRLGRRIVVAADAVPTTGEADRISALAARARARA